MVYNLAYTYKFQLKIFKDLHEAYENWLTDKKSPYDFPILKVIDANLDSEKVYKQIKRIIEQFFICE